MCASGRPITLLLLCLFGSAASSPVAIYKPSPSPLSQISPPSSSPTILPSPPSPSLSVQRPVPPHTGNSGDSKENADCPLKLSPSALVVRFGDPVTANCSLQRLGFPLLGWEVSLAQPPPTFTEHFLVWSVDNMTMWSIKPTCYAVSNQQGPCQIHLPLIVYKPPDSVSISFVNHSGPMLEGRQYTLQCEVQDVAPVQRLFVTFYKGQTVLSQLKSNNNSTEKSPVTEKFLFNVTPSKEDDGGQYWCEAKLELGPGGPQQPPVVASEKLIATVFFGPQLVCPAKLQLREGERLSCEVRGNPEPSVTWFKNGLQVSLPAQSSKMHAGTYTVLAEGYLGQRNFTVEVEVLGGSGPANRCNKHFLLVALLTQMINWL